MPITLRPPPVLQLGLNRTHISKATSHRLSIVFKVELNHFNLNRKISLKVSEKSKSILINGIDSPLSTFCSIICLSVYALYSMKFSRKTKSKGNLQFNYLFGCVWVWVCVFERERPWAIRDNNRSQWKYYLYGEYERQLIKFNDSKLICCRLCFTYHNFMNSIRNFMII